MGAPRLPGPPGRLDDGAIADYTVIPLAVFVAIFVFLALVYARA